MKQHLHSALAVHLNRYGSFLKKSSATLLLAFGISTPSLADIQFVNNAHLPTDVKQTCFKDMRDANKQITEWFAGDKITANGNVNAANSLAPIFADYQNNTLCDFYRWGSQMFLWLTSSTGNNGHVFNTSPNFYNISVEDNGQRQFEKSHGTLRLTVRKRKTDSEIELGQAGAGDVLISQGDSLVYYSLHANNVFALYTTGYNAGQLDAQCAPQDKACRTGNLSFPSSQEQLEVVKKFASGYGYSLENPDALAMELKASWVDASTVSNTNNYITATASVPAFSCSKNGSPKSVTQLKSECPKGPWLNVGETPKKLAMVGMHIVGSVDGHPEMVWATFEHANNVPDNSFKYTDKDSNTQTMAFNSDDQWNFLPQNAAKPASIVSNAHSSSTQGSSASTCILNVDQTSCSDTATSQQPNIEAVDVYRVNPFGNNPLDKKVIAKNTDLASLNVAVLTQLRPGDFRGNYIQTGSIWTAEGQIPPNYPYIFPPANTVQMPLESLSDQIENSYLRGSMFAANTTMETFYQYQNDGNEDVLYHGNCFACHGGGNNEFKPGYGKIPTNISHIFSVMQGLPKLTK